ncbi:MAG: ABC transporter substrate-binding protein [Spirochaetales bacterium]|nr:MAG: ABC transporter substrate-binding protein [Spirochaetales bacterium]
MIAIIVVLILAAGSVMAQQVLASTSWTAGFALLAGATDVDVLAPYEFSHPPEYELRPSDIRRAAEADLVVYAGYEVMVPRLLESIQGTNAAPLQIVTAHAWPVLTASVRAIAQELGTQVTAEATLAELRASLDDWANQIAESEYAGVPVVANFHQQALAREIGLNVVGVFGPAPLEAQQIRDLSELHPVLIIDNGHNPMAMPLEETTNARLVTWYNFPGVDGTRTIQDIFALNRRALEE